MTTITAKSILASRHADSYEHRVDTLLLRYPRWIHAEGRTHRVMRIGEDMEVEVRTPSFMDDENLSRNASSSRAIPVKRLIKDVIDDPAVPLYWGKNQKGMQASEELTGHELQLTTEAWHRGKWRAIETAKELEHAGAHKQLANRVLEPYSHITVVATATEWTNFFALRDHPDAEPHICMLAQAIKKAMAEATVQTLRAGEWHLPFVYPDERAGLPIDSSGQPLALKVSVARCASTSYKTVDGFDMTIGRAIELHDKLAASNPMHASPMEHQCYADRNVGNEVDGDLWARPKLWGNFQAFCQYRRVLEVGA